MTDPDADFDSEPEIPSDDEIGIILNVHMPQEDRSAAYQVMIPARPQFSGQFRPTNGIWLSSVKFVPPESHATSDPTPWRDVPSTMPEYFNYGFTEMVWEAYKFKQYELRRLYPDKNRVAPRPYGPRPPPQ
jgi:hypothetical protein